MSTEFESVKGWWGRSDTTELHITRFYGGEKHGVSVQLTPSRENYFCTDKDGVLKLIEQLSLAFELPTIARLEANKEMLAKLIVNLKTVGYNKNCNCAFCKDTATLLVEMEK